MGGNRERKTARNRAVLGDSVRRSVARTRASTGDSGRKKPTENGWFLEKWWSWRELNPRPQAFFGQIYMFSGLI